MPDQDGKQYVVTAAYLAHVPVSTAEGARLVDLNQGAVLPKDVPQDRIDHYLSYNPPLIAEVGAEGAVPSTAASTKKTAASGTAKSGS